MRNEDNTSTELIPTDTSSEENLSRAEIALNKRIAKFDKNGVTDDRLLTVLNDGLSAVKVTTELVDGCERVTEEPDHSIRHKYMDSAFKAKGYYACVEIKTEVNIDNRRVSVRLTKEDGERLLSIAETLRGMNRSLDMGEVQDGEIVSGKDIDG